jgi:hypothetical protein
LVHLLKEVLLQVDPSLWVERLTQPSWRWQASGCIVKTYVNHTLKTVMMTMMMGARLRIEYHAPCVHDVLANSRTH